MRKLYLFILLIAAQGAKAQDSTWARAEAKPSSFWEIGVLGGVSTHSEFIANTENTISPVYGVRIARHSNRFMFGVGYDAQTFALKTTQEGWPSETYKYANPQHTFYIFGNRVIRKGWGDYHIGLALGYSSGKSEDSKGFSRYESSKGMVAGLNIGATYHLFSKVSAAIEVNPKAYLLKFEKDNNKTETARVLTAPVQLGFKFRF
jgi:hypothetical protein